MSLLLTIIVLFIFLMKNVNPNEGEMDRISRVTHRKKKKKNGSNAAIAPRSLNKQKGHEHAFMPPIKSSNPLNSVPNLQ